MTSSPILKYFDPNKETVLSVDASLFGMEAVISQDGHTVEYASYSLNSTQQRYNHIEKDLLDVVFGCERFHYYLYGKKFQIQTDHRPLLGLLRKPLDDISPRIQRLAHRLLRYSFVLTYVPGKNQQVADTLSREPLRKLIQVIWKKI